MTIFRRAVSFLAHKARACVHARESAVAVADAADDDAAAVAAASPVIMSPWVRRALAGTLPPSAHGARAHLPRRKV